LGGVGVWAVYFWRDEKKLAPSSSNSTPVQYLGLLLILVTATLFRLYDINELPLGPYLDEILTLAHSLELLEKSFDLFGHTPLIHQGWVETPNLYLYFNLLILKLFGVSYISMKLFSVIPGVVTCVAVFVICKIMFATRVALWTSLLFTTAHWPVRLSRYGWDVSFMVMAFSLTIYLLLLALERRHRFDAYLSGVAAGVCLYGYAASRICLLSIVVFLLLECVLRKERWILCHAFAFMIGVTIVAFPLLCYYFSNPNAFWVRAAELSVFKSELPLSVILENIWRHALMFNASGGIYSRDNFPGLAMMDPVTGLIFIAGIVALLRNCQTSTLLLTSCTFFLNFAPGIFSISQEGAPYVYRTAAVMVPAFLIVGTGLQWMLQQMDSRPLGQSWRITSGHPTSAILLLVIALNVYQYFGLESMNAAAMRTMAYEQRLIGREIARDDLPVVVVGRDVLEKIEVGKQSEETYAKANPPMRLPLSISAFAVVSFSKRYELTKSIAENLTQPRNIYFSEERFSDLTALLRQGHVKAIFNSQNKELSENLRQYFPVATSEYIRNIHGEPIMSVATFPENAQIN
jgi:4-amino-4-deoxy-L-arabinose transferase-like glycosyltransferase